jgi:hypothetical protein
MVVKRMGKKSKLMSTSYHGEDFSPGSDHHVERIKRAITAKLAAHPDIAAAFVATLPRPIVHDTGHADPPDAVFPADVFCRVLADVRDEFACGASQGRPSLSIASGGFC